MKKQTGWLFILLIFSALLQVGCSEPAAAAESGEVLSSTLEEFTLMTGIVDGRMAYVGMGGEIDGLVNPDLVVEPGSSVVITLLNGDGMQHDLVIPDLDFRTPLVSSKDDKIGVVFEVGEEQSGTFPYYCSVAGHRQAGMEGRLIVSQP
jgi:nitrite reductase (NO-forming)